MQELNRESRMGGPGRETTARTIRRIDLGDFDRRKAEITAELWDAAAQVGFFQIVNHGITFSEIDGAFAAAETFFALPEEVKAGSAMIPGTNAGWESRTQVRPSTGTPDQKESFQVTRPRMDGLWPSGAGEFRTTTLAFEARCRDVAMKVLSCFADRLGFPDGFFDRAHDPESPDYQSTLRLLHYFGAEKGERTGLWRAGAHTDFDCLTLLFQREGQDGLQVCPGKEAGEEEWTPVPATADAITCNIGDMLMRWSGDRLPSNFHRVRSPGPDGDHGPRYSIAFFAQADREVVISSPDHPPVTAADYIAQRIAANFAAKVTAAPAAR
jgi:isopenicillin N synthase-like dioxygenase